MWELSLVGQRILKSLPKKFVEVTINRNYHPTSNLKCKIVKHNLKFEVQKLNSRELIPNLLLNREIRTPEDWKNVRKELLQTNSYIKPVNIDAMLLGYCTGAEKFALGYSYLDFLKQENVKLNLATIGKYFCLFYESNRNKKPAQEDEGAVFSEYQELCKAYKVLDSSTCENAIFALSITQHWKECLKLLNEIKIACVPRAASYSVTACAAFANNEHNLAWELLNETIDNNRTPLNIVYLAYLEQCEKKSTPKQQAFAMVEKLFEFFKTHDIKCNEEVAEKISHVCGNLKLDVKFADINDRGICRCCEQKLQKLELTEREFEDLKKSFLDNVIIGKDVFYKTTPDELERFQKFVDKKEKFDVVMDGLNVAYSAGVKQSTMVLSALVASTVRHFVQKNKKVLVLGRTHMENWPRQNWSYVTQNAQTFLTHSLSQDDPYFLYCALNCGLNTIIVSKDLMRGHAFRLPNPQLKRLFNRWLDQNQHQLLYVNNQGKVFFKFPLPYLRMAQKSERGWHIPYQVAKTYSTNGDISYKWICLR